MQNRKVNTREIYRCVTMDRISEERENMCSCPGRAMVKESLQGTWCRRLLGSRIQRLRCKRGLSQWKEQKEQRRGGTENLGCVWRRTWSELDGTELHVEGGSDGKESACDAGDPGSIPGSGRSPREQNGSPLQYSCLESSMYRGAWWSMGGKESDTTEQLTWIPSWGAMGLKIELTDKIETAKVLKEV